MQINGTYCRITSLFNDWGFYWDFRVLVCNAEIKNGIEQSFVYNLIKRCPESVILYIWRTTICNYKYLDDLSIAWENSKIKTSYYYYSYSDENDPIPTWKQHGRLWPQMIYTQEFLQEKFNYGYAQWLDFISAIVKNALENIRYD